MNVAFHDGLEGSVMNSIRHYPQSLGGKGLMGNRSAQSFFHVRAPLADFITESKSTAMSRSFFITSPTFSRTAVVVKEYPSVFVLRWCDYLMSLIEGVKTVSSFVIRSPMPAIIVVPPESTTLARRSLRI